ncbi:hypothetical protein BJP37_21050 [Moorena bouillonii PNG]|uniref:Uncharacterized protein n=1 Tax=Moorena bouillonii PNG TaxID=568701 RepID=A0A1U7N5E2_9CYAN|nr:hypothetical protein BJP37_21050 [Moorena bouillonii PNG]
MFCENCLKLDEFDTTNYAPIEDSAASSHKLRVIIINFSVILPKNWQKIGYQLAKESTNRFLYSH